MSKANGKWSYSGSWTEPYNTMQGFGLFSDPKEQFDQKTRKEMEIIVSTDKMVDKMLTFPDVEAILNKIRSNR